jgi:peptide deformylase
MIRIIPDPILRQRAKRVESINEEVARMIHAMLKEMYTHKGVGIAAPQVGLPYRIIGWDLYYRLVGRKRLAYVLINPQVHLIQGKEAHTMMSDEGCLSVPGVKIGVRRHQHITVTGTQLNGSTKIVRPVGMEAAVLQHEIDHLNGKLITNHRMEGIYGR